MCGNNSRIQEHDEEFRDTIEVKEKQDLLASNSRVFYADVVDHQDHHDQGSNVNQACCRLEDDCVVNVNVTGVANWDRAIFWAKQRARHHRKLLADAIVIAEREWHGRWCSLPTRVRRDTRDCLWQEIPLCSTLSYCMHGTVTCMHKHRFALTYMRGECHAVHQAQGLANAFGSYSSYGPALDYRHVKVAGELPCCAGLLPWQAALGASRGSRAGREAQSRAASPPHAGAALRAVAHSG